MLPDIPYKSATSKQTQTTFPGLDRRIANGNGGIVDMQNLTSDNYPVLSSRKKRYLRGWEVEIEDQLLGLHDCGNCNLMYVDGAKLYYSGTLVVSNLDPYSSEKQFAQLGDRVVIYPDKIVVDLNELGGLDPSVAVSSLNTSYTGSITICGTTYAGVPAEGNTIQITSATALDFHVGDAVTLSGATVLDANKLTVIIREVSEPDQDHPNLYQYRFYENTFAMVDWQGNPVTTITYANAMLSRFAPELDYLTVCENRIWGCQGDSIYACELGNPFNWNVFDGLSTDSYQVETGTPGGFTAATTYLGYPTFFKPDRIFKVYGNKPSNYEVISTATMGVRPNAHKSLAVAGETLYYLSQNGYVAYTGGVPSLIDAPLNQEYIAAVAASDGSKYYTRAVMPNGESEFLVFDPERGMWHKEDNIAPSHMIRMVDPWNTETEWGTCSYIVAGVGKYLYCLAINPYPLDYPNNDSEYWETTVNSSVTFGDFDYQSFDSKYPVRLWLRFITTGTVTVKISYNSTAFQTVKTFTAPTYVLSGIKSSQYMPVPIKRCDHWRLKIEATGVFRLYALEQEFRRGTESRR